MKKSFLILIASFILVSCGGGGGGGGSSSGDSKNLSIEPNLYNLYSEVRTNLTKGQFESTIDFNNRVNTYTSSLNGYHATAKVNVNYDADTQKLKIWNLPTRIDEGVSSSAPLYRGHTQLTIKNSDIISKEYDYDSTPTIIAGISYYASYYKIISMDSNNAQNISDGFRVDYTFTFPTAVVETSEYWCVSAYFTNCTNYLNGNILSYRVYNVIDGHEY